MVATEASQPVGGASNGTAQPSAPPAFDTVKVSKVERLKERSNYLRGPLDRELTDGNPFFSPDGTQILKFHGCYQQKDRDFEKAKARGEAPAYSMMLRTRSPGGFIPWQLYLALDRLADRYGNGTLRATTRQGFQLHGVLKENLKTVIADIVHHMGSTVSACGDINRNVMAPPAPFYDRPAYVYARQYAINLADLLAPQGGAYYEIWLDGEKVVTAEAPEVTAARTRQGRGKAKTVFEQGREPIYGTQYMPRKFKMAIAVPGDNSVDLFTNDLGLVVIVGEGGTLQGFNVYVGGGLGRTHNDDRTLARLADGIGFVPAEEIYEVVKAVVAVQRDFGDRYNRKHARLKYLLADWGVEKFKQTLLDYYPEPLAPLHPLPEFRYQDYLGWHDQGNGQSFLGISIENGRIGDRPTLRLKTALREIEEQYRLPMYLTPNHNVLLADIDPSQRGAIDQILAKYGIAPPEAIDPLTRYAMACPALPTCGLAITESERAIPSVIQRLRQLLNQMGLPEVSFSTRMTGCPNGCARPYTAEVGLVGSGVNEYQVWLGGSFDGLRLGQPAIERLPLTELEAYFEPLFAYYKRDRQDNERFGDFCHRKGLADLQAFAEQYHTPHKLKDRRHRITLSPRIYERLKELAEEQNLSMKELVEEAIRRHLFTEGT